jgi:hypothetical protein
MLDPRDSFVRVRSICTILQSSGHYFTGGNAHSKLKKFFVFFQRYLLTKEELPADLQATFDMLHTQLLPKADLYSTYEDAEKAAREYLAADECDREPDNFNPEDAPENDSAQDNRPAAPAETCPARTATEEADADQAEDDLFEKELANVIPGQACFLLNFPTVPEHHQQRITLTGSRCSSPSDCSAFRLNGIQPRNRQQLERALQANRSVLECD